MLVLLLFLISNLHVVFVGAAGQRVRLKDTEWGAEYRCALCVAVYSDLIDGTRSFKDACTGINACGVVEEGISIVDHDARSSCQSANYCGPQKVPNEKPKAIIHIGPPKTATTYIQSTLALLQPLLLQMNYLSHRFEYVSTLEPEFQQVLNVYFLQAKETNMGVIISGEHFSEYNEKKIAPLVPMLKDFEVSIVFTYREVMSRLISGYGQLVRYNPIWHHFAFFVMDSLSKFDATLDPSILRKWGSHFGNKNVIVLDYYGIQAEDRDVLDVLLCEAAGIWCDTTAKELLHGRTGAAYSAPESVKYFPLLNSAIFRASESSCAVDSEQLVSLVDHIHDIADSTEKDHSWLFPIVTEHFDALLPYAEQMEIDLRNAAEKAGMRWVYSNPEENRIKRETASFSQIAAEEMLYDPLWEKWFDHLMKDLRQNKAGYISNCR